MRLALFSARPFIIFLKTSAVLLVLVLLVAVGAGVYFLHFTPAPEPELNGVFTQHSLQFEARERTYSLYVPEKKPHKPALLFVLHGSKGSGGDVRQQSAYEFDLYAQERGYIAVYPDGFEKHWNGCRRLASYSANTQNINDVGFLSALAERLVEQYGADAERVFATGFSNGGHMTYRLAMEAADVFSGIAPIAASLPVLENLGCKPLGQPVSVAIFNGTEDPINPYGGGVVSLLGDSSRGLVRSSQETADYWSSLAGLKSPPKIIEHPERDAEPTSSVLEQHWSNGSATQVRLYTLQGSGHVIPSSLARFPRILGGQAGDISAAKVIGDMFFAE